MMPKRAVRRFAGAVGLGLIVALTGCGNQGEGQRGTYSTTFAVVKEQIKLRQDRRNKPEVTGPQFTRAMLSGIKDSLLSAELDSGEFVATLFVTARSGPYLTWKSADNVTISTRNDVVVQTRGFPNDLMAVGTGPVQSALAGGPGRGAREYTHLTGDNQLRTIRLICEVTDKGAEQVIVLERAHATRRLEERCTATDGQQVTNMFWLGGDGTIWASHQWLGPELGHIRLERYIR